MYELQILKFCPHKKKGRSVVVPWRDADASRTNRIPILACTVNDFLGCVLKYGYFMISAAGWSTDTRVR